MDRALQPATFTRRLIARALDYGVVALTAGALGLALIGVLRALEYATDYFPLWQMASVYAIGGSILFVCIAVPAIPIWINIYLLARGGQSIGKRLAGIKLVAPDGSRLSVVRILGLRMLAPAIPSAGGVVLYLIGPYVASQYVLSLTVYPLVIAYAIFRYGLVLRADRRGLHDHIAGTIVVSATGGGIRATS